MSPAARQPHPIKPQWSLAPPTNPDHSSHNLGPTHTSQLGYASPYPTQTSYIVQSAPRCTQPCGIDTPTKAIPHGGLAATISLAVVGLGMGVWLRKWTPRPKIQSGSYVRVSHPSPRLHPPFPPPFGCQGPIFGFGYLNLWLVRI